MADPWVESAPCTRVFVHAYDFKKFGPANAVAFDLGSGGFALLSAPPNPPGDVVSSLDDKGELEALIISNLGHIAGYSHWLAMKPSLTVYAPDDILEKLPRLGVETPVRPLSELETGAGVRVMSAVGTRVGGTWMRSELGARPVVFLDEIIINMRTKPRSLLARLAFWATGTKPELTVNRVFELALCGDGALLKKTALELLDGDCIIIPAHGAPLASSWEVDGARTLLRAQGGS